MHLQKILTYLELVVGTCSAPNDFAEQINEGVVEMGLLLGMQFSTRIFNKSVIVL